METSGPLENKNTNIPFNNTNNLLEFITYVLEDFFLLEVPIQIRYK